MGAKSVELTYQAVSSTHYIVMTTRTKAYSDI